MAVTDYGIEELKEEVQKCELICRNCHRGKHTNTETETTETETNDTEQEEKEKEEIENHTIDWDSYSETDIEIDG